MNNNLQQDEVLLTCNLQLFSTCNSKTVLQPRRATSKQTSNLEQILKHTNILIIFASMILFLSSIAGSEILVILLFVLIFFGAKSIPGMSRSLGRGIRQIKDASQEIQDEIRKTTGDMKKDMDINRTLQEATENFKKPFDNIASDLNRETNEMQRSLESNSTTLKKESVPEQTSVSELDSPKPEKENNDVV